jgi:hypothetical protein
MKFYKLTKKVKKEKAPVSYLIHGGEKSFITNEHVIFELSNGKDYCVDKGFVFDGASVPRVFWWFVPRLDDRILASIIHDHMYVTDYMRHELGDYEARLFADKEFLIWCNYTVPDKKWKNHLLYRMIRIFGAKIFKK